MIDHPLATQPAPAAAAARGPALGGLPAAIGSAIWGLFTSVRFAVAQITVIVCAALVGMIVHQVPAYALGPSARPADYANEMAKLHAQYDPALGTAVADVFERLGFFRVFTTSWFGGLLALLFVSILVCTLDRLPRLWHEVRYVRVAQPPAFFDPRLPGRVEFAPDPVRRGDRGWRAETLDRVLRRQHFRVRSETVGDELHVYGDRNQYTKLATLITHAGLLTFILGAAITANGIPFLNVFPAQIPIVLAQDQTQTIQPIGTPNLIVVKNLGFAAPTDADGRPLDFTTDLAIYQNGVQVARKTIRVNDPLTYGGYTFHQNFTGPAVDLDVRDSAGNPLWTGPLPLDDAPVAGKPYREFVVPGRDVILDLLLFRDPNGDVLWVTGSRQTGTGANGTPIMQSIFEGPIASGGSLSAAADGFKLTFTGVSSYTGLIARSDPGEYVVWVAFGLLIVGLLITFYLPRRRVWLRLDASGRLAVAGRSDRYVAFEREFSSLLAALAEAPDTRSPRASTPS